MKLRLFVDMDGTLAEWRQTLKFEELYEPGYFACLCPNEPVLAAVKDLLTMDVCEGYICSCYLENSQFAKSEKLEWLRDYLPEVSQDHILLVPDGSSKANYIPDGIKPTDILLDDYSRNLHEWVAAGGVGLKLMNGINGTRGTWKGPIVHMNKDDIINAITKLIR